MSVFTDAVLSFTPSFYYPMTETTGFFNDLRPTATGLTANGTIQRGTLSLLPGDAANLSVSQAKTTPIAKRIHNALWDGVMNQGTVMCWVKPSALTGSGVAQPLVIKGAQYSINLVASHVNVQWGIGGVTQHFNTADDLIVPDNAFFIVATYDDSPAESRILVNGVERHRQAVSGAALTSNSTGFMVGGQDFFGTGGMSGALQHIAVWHNIVLTDVQIRALYAVGAAGVAELTGQGANAFPWSRQILSPDTSRTRLRAANDSDVTVYLGLGEEIGVGGGYPLAPGQSTGRDLDGYTGALSCIHGNAAGAKRLALDVR